MLDFLPHLLRCGIVKITDFRVTVPELKFRLHRLLAMGSWASYFDLHPPDFLIYKRGKNNSTSIGGLNV